MIYLILNIALYLLMALICGAAAGWLARNNNALREEEELRRAVTELKDKLSQCESLLRGRDAQLNSLRAEVKAKDARMGELHDEINGQSNVLRSKDRELAQADAQRQSAQEQLDALALELSGADADGSADQLRNELQALESRLKRNRQARDRMSKSLEREQRRVVELERERELQSNSLLVLHEQLDLERARAAGGN